MINPLRPEYASMTALTDVLTRASTARSNFNWTSYLPAPPTPLSPLTEMPLNPYIPADSPCVFGCKGHLCNAADGCAPSLLCKNNICQQNSATQPGQMGSVCNSKKPCQTHLQCTRGSCQPCASRPTLGTPGTSKTAAANDASGTCPTDELTTFFSPASRPRTCLSPSARQNPCESPLHCSSTSFCSWGLCSPCRPSDLCLGASCKSSNACKTGYCNDYGRCDYAGQKTLVFGPGVRGRWKNTRVDGVPEGHERGPARVRSEALRIVIPTEGVMETGRARAVS